MRTVILKIITVFIIMISVISGCRAKLHSPSEPELFTIEDITPANPEIIITNPQKYSIWNRGETMVIKWSASNSFETIYIQLFRKNNYQFTIITNIENKGYYNWYIPYEIDNSNHYQLKIINHNNPAQEYFSNRFAILD